MKNLAYLFLILSLISIPRIIVYYYSGGLTDFKASSSFSQFVLQISIANLPHYHIENLSEEDLQQIEFHRYISILTDLACLFICVYFILYWKITATKISNEYTAQSPSPNLYCLEV